MERNRCKRDEPSEMTKIIGSKRRIGNQYSQRLPSDTTKGGGRSAGVALPIARKRRLQRSIDGNEDARKRPKLSGEHTRRGARFYRRSAIFHEELRGFTKRRDIPRRIARFHEESRDFNKRCNISRKGTGLEIARRGAKSIQEARVGASRQDSRR